MKKSIFLFFAAILCAMTANAQWALMGTLTDWSSGKAMTVSGTTATCTVDLAGATEYKLKVKNGGTWYGRNSTTISNTTTTSAFNKSGGDVTLKTTIPGTYTFSFDTGTKKLTVTYPEVPALHDITVRAKLPATWTSSTITAWVWTSENASGTAVTAEKDGDYYKITKNAGALYVIFRNGANWNGDKNQTVDLVYTEDVCLQLNQSGTAKATATVIDCGAVSKDITVKAVVPGAWENTITAWVWPTGGEGKEVTPTKEGNWYVITENCIELNVIFKNGTGWNGNENQTANITGVSENTCYQISAINKDGEGKCTYTVVDCEAVIEPEVKPVDVYTIVGAETLVGTAWDLNNTDNDMTKQGDGSYVLVKENVELATTGTYEYKVVKNRSWDWKGVNEGNNLTLTGVDVDGTYNVTFTLNKELNALTASLELVEAKKVIPECYVAGDESLTGQNWNAKSVLMTYDEATEVYTATLTAVPAGTHNMKVVYGGEWLGFDHLATPAPANVKEGDDKKIQFTLAEAGNVTVTYHATNGIGLTGNFAVPTPKYYIAGTQNLTGFDWKENGLEMTKVDDVYKHTFSELGAGIYEFKITDGTWTNPWGYSNLGAAYEEVSEGTDGEGNPNGNIKFVTEEAKNITVIFDPAAGKITIGGLTEKAPVVSTYALMGVGGDWTTGITMTVNPDNADEYVLKAQSISSTDAIKVLETAGSTQTWHSTVDAYSNATFELVDDGFGGKNIVLTAGTYNFYFKKINNEIYIEEVYVRDVTNTYGTICLPYASNSYDGAIFYRVAGKETGKVYLESVSELEAGVPYIFEKTASKIVVARNGAPVANAGSANGLVGTFTNETEVAAGNYILYNNQLRPSDGTAKVNANRAYLKLDAVTGGQPTQMPGRRYIGMDVQGENEATGFENIVAPEGQALKVIENGQLIIIRGNEKFNAQGVRL